MSDRKVAALAVVAVCGIVVGVRAGEKASSPRFEAIKTLAGDWVEVGKDGKPTDKLVTSFRVTAGGTAVQETIFPGTAHEMVTMYHLDGKDLVLTHYCMLGNQPRMRTEASGDPARIPFKFAGASNLKSENDNHMHEATFTLLGADRLQAEWTACKDGQACHSVKFDLVRKPR